MPIARRLLLPLALMVAACSPRLIPGTPLEDNADNRAILDVLRQYKNAFEARDAASIATVASPRYLDARDSISRDTLDTHLAERFEHVKDARLDIQVRRIEVERRQATVEYFYATAFLIDAAGADWVRESDDKRMTLEHTNDGWKVLNGL
ncbi:MAG: hypothetical protein RL199_1910 [Pseudomonadota bacterium]|jgi:hypothetical protein